MTKDKLPTSFDDLGVAELRRTAVEDFAVDVKNDDNKQTVLAALFESGVTWDQYVECHPEVRPEDTELKEKEEKPAPKAKPSKNNVVTAAPTVFEDEKPYLIKMVRDNPLFQTRGYTFTKEHPYALVSPEDAEYILSREDGFRQARPSELEEFYN